MRRSHLLDTGAIIALEASCYAVRRSLDIAQLVAVEVLGIRAHARNCEDLLIFLNALL